MIEGGGGLRRWAARFLAAFLFVSSVTLVLDHHLHADAGFRLYRIQQHTPDPSQVAAAPSDEQREAVAAILDQQFYYLGKGAQCYCFVSEDCKYVLKFFKHYHLHLPYALENLWLPGPLKDWRDNWSRVRAEKKRRTFQSYELCARVMPEESGLVAFQWNGNYGLDQKVKLRLPSGTVQDLDLSTMDFLLQQYVEPAIVSIEKGDARAVIDNYLDMISQLTARGLVDRDRSFDGSFGFVGDSVVMMDVGEFYYDESIKSGSGYVRTMDELVRRLCHWLEPEYPELASYSQERWQEQLASQEVLGDDVDGFLGTLAI